jgi:dienelactone hydrolase
MTSAAFILAASAASAEIVSETFEYEVGGTTFQGHVAYNSDLPETRGTVVILHDWDGLTDYEVRRAEMLAALGYTGVAIDVYGRGSRPTSMEENQQMSGALYGDRSLFQERLTGSIDAAAALDSATDEMVMIGYCFGGAGVLEAARAGTDLAGYVSFHGGLGTPEGQDYSQTSAPVLLLHGSADPVSGMSDLAAVLDELQAAGVEHDAQVFGGARHSFTVWGSDDYDVAADQGSWTALQMFLDETF